MGGLYLAYDLLGGQRGPLRTLTRWVTYALLFGTIYGIVLGPLFGLIAGPGLACVVILEVRHIHAVHARQAFSLNSSLLIIAMIRGVTLGIASGLTFGPLFGLIFGLFSGLGLISVYFLRLSPTETFLVEGRFHVKRQILAGSLVRGLITGSAGVLARASTHFGIDAIGVGLLIGVVVWLASSVGTTASALVEWWADHLPAQRLGMVGTALLLLGFLLLTVQYWLALFDIPIR